MNAYFIHERFKKAIVASPTVDEAVQEVFLKVFAEADEHLLKIKANKRAQFVAEFEEAATSWAEACKAINVDLETLGSPEKINPDSFKEMLRDSVPDFYAKLVLSGLIPCPSDEEKLKELKEENQNGTV